jgi:hypothetical protein
MKVKVIKINFRRDWVLIVNLMIFKMTKNIQSYCTHSINVLIIWIILFHKTKTILIKADMKIFKIKLKTKYLIKLIIVLVKNTIQVNLFQIQQIIKVIKNFLILFLKENLKYWKQINSKEIFCQKI